MQESIRAKKTFLLFTPSGRSGRIEDVVIDEQHRGRGLGERLIKELIRRAKDRCCRYVELTVPARTFGEGIRSSAEPKPIAEKRPDATPAARGGRFTSRPQRKAANLLYQKLGFQRRETNVYRLSLNNMDRSGNS